MKTLMWVIAILSIEALLFCAVVGTVAIVGGVPTAVVCDRGPDNTEVHITSTRPQGRIAKSYFGICVLYTHVSRHPTSYGGD
jgi:hypothetical protein